MAGSRPKDWYSPLPWRSSLQAGCNSVNPPSARASARWAASTDGFTPRGTATETP